MPPRTRAFSLVELLVVVTIIVVLLALMVPAMERAMEAALRAKCATQLRAIHRLCADYASSNKGYYFICRLRSVPHAISNGTHKFYSKPGDGTTDWFAAAMSVGLAINDPTRPGGYRHQAVSGASLPTDPNESIWPAKIWRCPSVEPGEEFSAKYQSLVLGYQYLGGILTWSSPYDGNRPSRSPARAQNSEGAWVFAADQVHMYSGRWVANHRDFPESRLLSGGNQVYVDGAVSWESFWDMALIHSWDNNASEFHLFKQADLGADGLSPNALAKEIAQQYPG
jgi:prepilin-type N-terminal cleavage/methylation domain-containing protein